MAAKYEILSLSLDMILQKKKKKRKSQILSERRMYATKIEKPVRRCGKCTGCLRKNCGNCTPCKLKIKFGGDGQ